MISKDQLESINTLFKALSKLEPLITKCRKLQLDESAYALETFASEMPKAIERDQRRLSRNLTQDTLLSQTERTVVDKEPRLFR